MIRTLHTAVNQYDTAADISKRVRGCRYMLNQYTPDKDFTLIYLLMTVGWIAAGWIVLIIFSNVIETNNMFVYMLVLIFFIYANCKGIAGLWHCLKNTKKYVFGSVLSNKHDMYTDAYREASDEYDQACDAFTRTCDTLSIPSQYRNQQALMKFTNYLSTGRAFTLEGPGGAYNLYEQEMRMDALNGQMHSINGEVAAVQQNQKNLNQSVRSLRTDMNNQAASFSAKVSDISRTAGETRDYAKSAGEDIRRIRELADRAAR